MTSPTRSLPFDRAHLSTFTNGDMALERDLLEHFAVNAETHIKVLQDALGSAKWEEGAHRLKGAASGVGMQRFAQLCAQAENLDCADVETAKQLLTAMEQELSSLVTYLEAE